MTQRKAKHDGTCQICGNLQRAPGGMMAKHGYTVPHGYFQGVCYGSDQIPFEQSKELLEKHIVDINLQASTLANTILGYEMHPARITGGDTFVWKEVKLPKAQATVWDTHKDHEVHVRVRSEPGNPDGNVANWYKADWLNPYTNEWEVWPMMIEDSEAGLLRELIKPFIYNMKRHLEFLQRHLVWQRGRAKGWKLLPLPLTVPELEGKDFIVTHTTEGFVRGTEGLGGWNGFNVWYTPDRALAKRYTERGAAMMIGKVRGKNYHNHKSERF